MAWHEVGISAGQVHDMWGDLPRASRAPRPQQFIDVVVLTSTVLAAIRGHQSGVD